ncbi:MAG: DMT family transporter [Betaproteobacteria bacterium]|nr:DMT family transporter [Betaproteobacteria bacterium]
MQSLWMVVAAFLFSCMGVCVKLAAEAGYSPAEIVFYRNAIALVLMGGSLLWGRLDPRTPLWKFQIYRGVSGFISLMLYFYAIAWLPLATAVTLNYTSPLFLALFLAGFSGNRLPRPLLGALFTGFAGVVVLLKPTLHADQLLGGLVGLASGVLAGLAYYNVRELGQKGEPEWRTVFYFSLISTVGGGLWMLFFQFHAISLRGGLLLLGVGIFATLAQLAMTRAYARGRTLVAASLAYTAVVFASLFGMVFWGEVLGLSSWAAIALIVLSGMAATRVSRANPAEQD